MKKLSLVLTVVFTGSAALADTATQTPTTKAQIAGASDAANVMSSKSKAKKPEYAYSNPMGVGPNNDSR